MASTRPDDMGATERDPDLAADPGTEVGSPAPARLEALPDLPVVEPTAAAGRPEPRPGPRWGPLRRILFRFLCAYVVLTVLPFPFNVVPLGSFVDQAYQSFWNAVVPFVGWAVFGVDVPDRPVEAAPIGPLFRRRWLDRAALVLRTVLVVALVGYSLYSTRQLQKTYGSLAPRPPLHGIWEVTEFAVDGEVRPPLLTDELRWRRMVFTYPGFVRIQHMDETRKGYSLVLDEKARTLALTRRDDKTWKSTLSYRRTAPGALAVEGSFDGHRIQARLRRAEESEFLLLERGFRWVNEVPYNR